MTIDRLLAAAQRARADPLDSGRNLVFQQIMRQLKPTASAIFSSCDVGTQSWKASIPGFGATDAGGPFRDSITEMIEELQTTASPLFCSCANGREAQGDNRHKFVLRSQSQAKVHPEARGMFFFLGQLMGMAIRTSILLPLDLPSMFWKKLCGQPITAKDVSSVDLG